MQFQNKELVCTFSCVYLSLLHPAQNKRVYRLNTELTPHAYKVIISWFC